MFLKFLEFGFILELAADLVRWIFNRIINGTKSTVYLWRIRAYSQMTMFNYVPKHEILDEMTVLCHLNYYFNGINWRYCFKIDLVSKLVKNRDFDWSLLPLWGHFSVLGHDHDRDQILTWVRLAKLSSNLRYRFTRKQYSWQLLKLHCSGFRNSHLYLLRRNNGSSVGAFVVKWL